MLQIASCPIHVMWDGVSQAIKAKKMKILGAVSVVKQSVYFPATSTISVRIPLEPLVFIA